MSNRFFKMQGCGNDFIFLDAMRAAEGFEFSQEEIRFLCDRHFGPGADGFVILHSSRVANAGWDFYNSDGSVAEMCGNAARCAIKYLHSKYFPEERVIALETLAGVIKGKPIERGWVEVTLVASAETFPYEEKIIKKEDQALRLCYLNVGVPHAVIEVHEIRGYPIDETGRFLVKHPAFGEEGTNVTFFQRTVGNRILATTFERGLERETLACGTGAAAAAIIFSEQYLQPFPMEVVVPGGELGVEMSPSRKLLLQGPAEYVMDLEIENIPRNFQIAHVYGRKGKE
jgi:diaminopimelate epimerase